MVHCMEKGLLNILIYKRINGILVIKGISNMVKNGDLEFKEIHKAYIEDSFQKDVGLVKDGLKTEMETFLMEFSKRDFWLDNLMKV